MAQVKQGSKGSLEGDTAQGRKSPAPRGGTNVRHSARRAEMAVDVQYSSSWSKRRGRRVVATKRESFSSTRWLRVTRCRFLHSKLSTNSAYNCQHKCIYVRACRALVPVVLVSEQQCRHVRNRAVLRSRERKARRRTAFQIGSRSQRWLHTALERQDQAICQLDQPYVTLHPATAFHQLQQTCRHLSSRLNV